MSLIVLSQATAAAVPWHHVIPGDPPILFVVEGSAIYSLDPEIAAAFAGDPETLSHLRGKRPAPPVVEPYPSAVSLNLAQSCNLACSYCYADEGKFGGVAKLMPVEVALRAVRQLLEHRPARGVSVGFIGGEPLLNRTVMRAVVEFASREAARTAVPLTFGITTNATLIDAADVDLFRSHPFAITVSLDGPGPVNDALRPAKRGAGSFDHAMRRIRPLLENPGLAKLAARCTVTRRNLDIAGFVEALCEAGFSEAGVSPLRTGPNPALCLQDSDWPTLLDAMKHAAAKDWERARTGGGLRFSNFAVALKQLHRGAAAVLPCDSAVRYVSLSAEGNYYTCHRTLGDARFRLGGEEGPSAGLRTAFVYSRHVDSQEPCRSCWARYLCGGGCHAEVIQSGRAGCDYIRGWLEFCISMYPQVLSEKPELLA